MKRIIKVILFFCLLLNSIFVFAQTEEEYLDSEKTRMVQAEVVENEIQDFISNNLNAYSLSQSKTDEILLTLTNDTIHGNLSQEEKDLVLLNFKKDELRKLYFENYPEKLSLFSATSKSQSLLTACINGGFENDYTGYTFKRISFGDLGVTLAKSPCNFRFEYDTPEYNIPILNFAPVGVNQYQNPATIVTNTSGGVFEPLLASLGVNIPKVKTGSKCLKINPTPATIADAQVSGDFTWVRGGDFTITQNQIQFSFLFIGTIADHGGQPIFGYRLVDKATGNILRNECIPIDTNDCRFRRVTDTRTQGNWAGSGTIVGYTNWVCETINTDNLINQDAYLEFFVSDCNNRGHYATVYIDDVCGGVACTPISTWGNISIDPINVNCPTEPFNICGSFTMPAGISMNSLQLSIQSIGVINVTPVIIGNRFCFTVNPFGPLLQNIEPSGSYFVNVTVNPGTACALRSADKFITFNNCCFSNLIETTSIQGNRQRGDWIVLSGWVSSSNRVVRHAGNFVELLPNNGVSAGFQTYAGAEFSAYIDECNSGFTYKNDNSGIELDYNEKQTSLIKNKLIIYPNPANSYFTVNYANEKFNRVIITSLEGRVILNQKVEATNSYQLDISNYKTGIYTLSVQTNDGNTITDKLIKN